MGVFYDYTIIILSVLYCIFFSYSILQLFLSWCIVGFQKGNVLILSVVYVLILFFDSLMIIMITSYHHDIDQQYVNNSNIPTSVRIIGEYIILYLNFILNGIILLSFLHFFGGLFDIILTKKIYYTVLIVDIIYFLIILISSILIEITDINVLNIEILSYIYIISTLINIILCIFCLCKLPIALPIDLEIGLYQRNTVCSCYTVVTRYIWFMLVILLAQIALLIVNIFEFNVWQFHINERETLVELIASRYLNMKHLRIILFSSQFIMLCCVWDIIRISIAQNVELNIVLNVMKDVEQKEQLKEELLLSITEEIKEKEEQQYINQPPQIVISQDTHGQNVTLLMVHQNSHFSDETQESLDHAELQQEDTETETAPIIINKDMKSFTSENEADKEMQMMQYMESNETVENMDETNNIKESQKEIQMMEFVGTEATENVDEMNDAKECFPFQVIADALCLYSDKALEYEIFSMQINKKAIVNGYYINDDMKVLYLSDYKAFVSADKLNELPPDHNADNNAHHDDNNDNNDNHDDNNDIKDKELIKFQIVVDGMCLYRTKELTEEIFSVQIANGETVDGFYVDETFKIVCILPYRLFVSSLDVRETGREQKDNKVFEDHNYTMTTKININAPAYVEDVKQSTNKNAVKVKTMSFEPKILIINKNNNDIESSTSSSSSSSSASEEKQNRTNNHNNDDINDEGMNSKPNENKDNGNDTSSSSSSLVQKIMNEEMKLMEKMHAIDDIKDEEMKINKGNGNDEASISSSSSFVANVPTQNNNNNNNNNNANDNDDDGVDDDEEMTVNTEINYSYSASSDDTDSDTDPMGPNIIVKFE